MLRWSSSSPSSSYSSSSLSFSNDSSNNDQGLQANFSPLQNNHDRDDDEGLQAGHPARSPLCLCHQPPIQCRLKVSDHRRHSYRYHIATYHYVIIYIWHIPSSPEADTLCEPVPSMAPVQSIRTQGDQHNHMHRRQGTTYQDLMLGQKATKIKTFDQLPNWAPCQIPAPPPDGPVIHDRGGNRGKVRLTIRVMNILLWDWRCNEHDLCFIGFPLSRLCQSSPKKARIFFWKSTTMSTPNREVLPSQSIDSDSRT